jgi:hypothetical protein
METGQQLPRSGLTEAILLALIPASAYLWAFYYELGFCTYFHISSEMISLNTTVVLVSSRPIFLIMSLVLFSLLFLVWSDFFQSKVSPYLYSYVSYCTWGDKFPRNKGI